MYTSNHELDQAWEFVEHTGKSLFLTGRAGTGKTTFLRRVVEQSTKRLIVVAPTGVAAINAGGVTIHSFFQLPPQPFTPGAVIQQKFNFSKIKRRIIASLDLLIIDEVSMVRSDVLDAVDSVLQRYRPNGLPFGGVQLLLIGDLQQLTPVLTPEEEQLLTPFYDTPYFFGSRALRKVDYVTVELQHVFRQQQSAFLDLLNHIREGQPTASDLQQLNSRYQPAFVPDPNEGYVRLTTHNALADDYNNRQLKQLKTRSVVLDAEVSGAFPDNIFPTSEHLELKAGAQVMFIKNDPSFDHAYYNGRIGYIESIDLSPPRDWNDEAGKGLFVRCADNGDLVNVQPLTWENTTYTLNERTQEIESNILGTFKQMPLRLAWAITIHKSQGLTFDKTIIEADAAFASGQVYVALSRCRTLEGLVLAAPIKARAIINDPRVANYISGQQANTRQSIAALPALVEAYYAEQLHELFTFTTLLRTERYLVRQLQEFFSRKNTALLRSHEEALAHLQTQIDGTAEKWRRQMDAMTPAQLRCEAMQERVAAGCKWFHEQLRTTLSEPMAKAQRINSTNKQALHRYEGAWEELQTAYLFKVHLLRFIAQHGFSVANYLRYKQQAALLAIDGRNEENEVRPLPDGQQGHRQKSPNKPSPKDDQQPTQRKKREDTKAISYRMYCAGMTVEQVAQERHLAPGTIMGHLAHYVQAGGLPLSEFVSDAQQQAVLKAAKRPDASRDEGGKLLLKPIVEACAPDVSYAQVRMTLLVNGLLTL